MNDTILALDIGTARTGVAIASLAARLPRPLTTVSGDQWQQQVAELALKQQAVALVAGLPRNLEGEDTAQTTLVRQAVESLRPHVTIPIYYQDEALTSQQAEAELQARGVSYTKGDIDALSATLILEDFLNSDACRSLA